MVMSTFREGILFGLTRSKKQTGAQPFMPFFFVSFSTRVISFVFLGKGRGRQVIAVARTSDVVIMMLEATKGEVQRSAEGGEGPLRGRMAWEESSAFGGFS